MFEVTTSINNKLINWIITISNRKVVSLRKHISDITTSCSNILDFGWSVFAIGAWKIFTLMIFGVLHVLPGN